MSPAELVNLSPLMARTSGRPSVRIGLIDGPVALTHGDLRRENLREIVGGAACARADSMPCLHGTFVAGILTARRGSLAPAICPDCTLLVRPLFSEAAAGRGQIPSAKPDELAQAIIDCLDAGATIIN